MKKKHVYDGERHRFYHATDPVARDRPSAVAASAKDDGDIASEEAGSSTRRSGLVPPEDQEAAMELMKAGRLYRYDVSPGEDSVHLSFKNGAVSKSGKKTKLLIYLVEEE